MSGNESLFMPKIVKHLLCNISNLLFQHTVFIFYYSYWKKISWKMLNSLREAEINPSYSTGFRVYNGNKRVNQPPTDPASSIWCAKASACWEKIRSDHLFSELILLFRRLKGQPVHLNTVQQSVKDPVLWDLVTQITGINQYYQQQILSMLSAQSPSLSSYQTGGSSRAMHDAACTALA